VRKTVLITTTFLIAVTAAVLVVGDVLSFPARSIIGPPPARLGAITVTIPVSAGQVIVGWYAPGTAGQGAILLLHGVRSDRRQMLPRAEYLHTLGYSVLLIDLQAHGESSGSRISFGYREGDGVKAALNFLRSKNPADKIGVIGVSLGAASFVLAGAVPAPNAVILESMYPTIEEAVSDRLQIRLGASGAYFTPVLLTQLGVWLGISSRDLRPIDHLAAIAAPVYILAGTADRHTTVAEARRLFTAAMAPKQLWLVEGAAHVDLYNYNPQHYQAKISAFLQTYLVQNTKASAIH
jgi:fermentation-respiration switch protein FrsA (DUF1100 family)